MTLMPYFIQFLMAMIGTLAFAVLFHAPQKEYIYCSLNGAIGWLVYYALNRHHGGIMVPTFFATFVLTILARCFSVTRKNPATVFLVPGIFPLVPGAGIYYTSYYLIMNDFTNFSLKGAETFKIAGVIVLGIIFGFSIPQSLFHRLFRQ